MIDFNENCKPIHKWPESITHAPIMFCPPHKYNIYIIVNGRMKTQKTKNNQIEHNQRNF